MIRTRTISTERPFLLATAAGKGMGNLPIGSLQSRAAARSLVAARQESEAGGEWDRDFDLSGLAELLAAARQRREHGEVPKPDWLPIYIPPGKEDTVRGRLAVRTNAARARMARLESEKGLQGDAAEMV
jgi:hypothetical protein